MTDTEARELIRKSKYEPVCAVKLSEAMSYYCTKVSPQGYVKDMYTWAEMPKPYGEE